MSIFGYKPIPAPPRVFKDQVLPLHNASILSKIFFQWVTPILKAGYSRPLEPDDLWSLSPDLQAKTFADKLQEQYLKRLPPSKRIATHPTSPSNHNQSPDILQVKEKDNLMDKRLGRRNTRKLKEGKIAYEDGKIYDMSLAKAMYFTIRKRWWISVMFLATGYLLRVTSPLITQQLINQISASHDASIRGEERDSLGYGVGLAFALFGMQFIGSMFTFQADQRTDTTGFLLRAATIDLINRKSMRLSSKSRIEMTNGRITTMISADASYLDWAVPQTIEIMCLTPQILVGMGLLIYTLGYSALVGLAVLMLAAPFQTIMFKLMLKYRSAQQSHVDKRVRLTTEIITNIRAVKIYAYESFFGAKTSELRKKELVELKKNGLNKSTMTATMLFIPTLAAVLSFVTYSLSGHELNPAIIFGALQYFNVLKQPIAFLPMILSSLSDSVSAIRRIGAMLQAKEVPSSLDIDVTRKFAIEAQGDYIFEMTDNDHDPESQDKGDIKNEKTDLVESDNQGGFSLSGINLEIPRGSLVCIVGRVGSGKSALLSALLNNIKQTSGHTYFGGEICYVPQQAWVHSGTIRDNITFGDPNVDHAKLNEVIEACCLKPDIARWSNGLDTHIGERGINLSGGQRQRISLARTAYDTAPIVLLDDPLSAVDAHVGAHLLQKCILNGPLSHRTRVLVTHQLDVLPSADLVVVMEREGDVGRIVQQGSYANLRNQSGVFQDLMKQYGSSSTAEHCNNTDVNSTNHEDSNTVVEKPSTSEQQEEEEEERETGELPWKVYTDYLRCLGGWWWTISIAALLIGGQAASVANSLFLGYWSADSIPGVSQGGYMALYGGLGALMAVFSWTSMYAMTLGGLRASFKMFGNAWNGVMRSPISWHDQTPSGRIISRLSKDIQMLDDTMAQLWNNFLTNALTVVGSFALVLYTYPYLAPVFLPLSGFFYLCSTYYRSSSREIKRIDSVLRSHVYSSFSEQLAGLSVIRAFGKQKRYEHRLQSAVNREGQAYILTITIQRWLSVRLELIAQLLILLIALFGVIFAKSVDPARFGVVLTYTIATSMTLSVLVPLFARCEQEMNNVERVQAYGVLPSETAGIPTGNSPVESWPSRGHLVFQGVEMRYKPDLPLVLKGIDFEIQPGQKIGIVGTTGAGKSSIAQALFRMVDIDRGRIMIDGLDLKQLDLEILRRRLSIIPQDTFLFEATLRENIDPTGIKSDYELNHILSLIHSNPLATASLREKFKLDTVISNEGSNFSAGEQQLLALLRALVKGSKLILLDEATSSVDPQTDVLIQQIIQTQFSDNTLISIAHRLQTVAYYDKVIVMEAGRIIETGSPIDLYNYPNSVFRSLCDQKRLSRRELLTISGDARRAKLRGLDAANILARTRDTRRDRDDMRANRRATRATMFQSVYTVGALDKIWSL